MIILWTVFANQTRLVVCKTWFYLFLHNASSKLCIFKVPAEVCKYLETLSRVVWNSDDLSQGEPDLVADQVVVEVLRPQLNPHEVLLDPLGQVLALAVRVETLQQFSRVSPHSTFLSRARQDL